MLWSSAWTQSTEDLVNSIGCQHDEIILPMLGATFFERGWLAPSRFVTNPSDVRHSLTITLPSTVFLVMNNHFLNLTFLAIL